MRISMCGRWALLATLSLSAGMKLMGQTSASQWRERLARHPLYLRGFWMADRLEFDGAGQLVSKSLAGPVTLSGIDVKSVSGDGKKIVIHGERVGLIADSDGRLQRRVIHSTALIVPSLRRGEGHKFKANEEVSIVVQADRAGSFEPAMAAIFADGLKELATSVPEYWSCYAEGYFASDEETVNADKVVEDCVARRSLAPEGTGGDDFAEPKLLSTVDPRFSERAAELGVSGMSRVHFTVSKHGIPVGFQIVQAVGAGMDEELLTAVYRYKFQPATRNGTAVAADSEFTMRFNMAH